MSTGKEVDEVETMRLRHGGRDKTGGGGRGKREVDSGSKVACDTLLMGCENSDLGEF
jgi:hypothetical protein